MKAGIDYRGSVNWSAGVTGSLSSELAKPQKDSGLTRDEILLKLAKTLDFVKDLLNTTGGFAGSIKFTVTIDAENVKLKSATVSISQKKQYGFKFLGSSIVDQGDGNMRTMTFRITDRDPEKLQKAVEQMAIVQAALGYTALAGPILAPPPQIAPDFLTDQIVKLISYADEYEKVLETGKGISFPIGLSKLLKGTPLVKSDKPNAPKPPVEDFSAEAALNFDSATSYVTERGVIRRGGMFALERYPDPDPLAPVSGDLAVAFLNDAKKVLETITDNYQSIKTVVGKVTTLLDKRFSPSGVTLEINGAAEPDGPEPFEVGLFAFKYTPVPGPLVPTIQSPEDVGGAVERPHYGVGGFFQFTPEGRTLAAPAKLTIHYLDTETAGLDESAFAIYRWNQQTLDWNLIGGVVDPVNHNVSTTVSVLGLYTVAPRMPAGRIAFTVQAAGPVDPQMPTTATFTSGVITLNSGGIVPDGTPFTVVTSVPDALTLSPLGTITTADADPLTDGVQVVSHGGVIRFTVTLPAGVTVPRVVGFATGGTAFGSQVVPLQ